MSLSGVLAIPGCRAGVHDIDAVSRLCRGASGGRRGSGRCRRHDCTRRRRGKVVLRLGLFQWIASSPTPFYLWHWPLLAIAQEYRGKDLALGETFNPVPARAGLIPWPRSYWWNSLARGSSEVG